MQNAAVQKRKMLKSAVMAAATLSLMLACAFFSQVQAFADTVAVLSSENGSNLLEATDKIECEVHSTGDVVAYAQDDPKERYAIKNVSKHSSTGASCSTQLFKVTIGELSEFSTYPNITITIDNTVVAKYENRKYKQGNQYTLAPDETVYPRIHIDNWTSLSSDDRKKIKENPADLFNIKYFASSNNSDSTLERVYGGNAADTNYQAFKHYQEMCKSDKTLMPINELIITAGHDPDRDWSDDDNGNSKYCDDASYANFHGAITIAGADEASGNYKTIIAPSIRLHDENMPGCGDFGYIQILKELNGGSNKQIEKIVIVGGTWEDRTKIRDSVKAYMNSENDIDIPEPSYANKNASCRTVYAYQYVNKTYDSADKDTAIIVSNALGTDNSEMINASICVASYAISNNIPVFVYDEDSTWGASVLLNASKYKNVVLVGDLLSTYKDGSSLKVSSTTVSGTKLIEQMVKGLNPDVNTNISYIAGSDQASISLNFAKWALGQDGEVEQTLNYCSCTNNSAGHWMDLGSSTSLIASKRGIQLGGFDEDREGQTVAPTIPASIKNFLSGNVKDIGHMYIFGGIHSVSGNIETQMKSILGGAATAAAALASTSDNEISTVSHYDNSVTIPWGYPLRCVASNGNPLSSAEYQMDEYVKCYTASDTSKTNPIYCSIKWDYGGVSDSMYNPLRNRAQEFDLVGTIIPPTDAISFKTGVSDKITVHVKAMGKS